MQHYVTVALVALLSLGASCEAPRTADNAAALTHIEALHARDEEASRAQDHAALATLWTADGVMLAPGARRVRGPELFAQLDERAARQERSAEVLEYSFDFEEVVVVGDYAFEWGVVQGKTRDLATGAVAVSRYKLLRVLRREGGDWRVHRAIWNALED